MSEFMPVDAYRLLRRLAVGNAAKVEHLKGPDDDAAVGFLLSRGFAAKNETGERLVITDLGTEFGRVTSKSPG